MGTESELVAPGDRARGPLTARLGAAVMAGWGALIGVVPHALHHVGPLAGAALVAGATGKVVFGVIGLVASIPFLRRLYRRFHTWRAPAAALGVFVVGFAVSALVIGPAISDSDAPAEPGIQQPSNHAGHHGGSTGKE